MDVFEQIRRLLFMAKNGKAAKDESSLQLSSILVNDVNGLLNLFKATLDVDESSQKQTTHLQRMTAIATIVGRMPKLVVEEDIYFQSLSSQLFALLKLERRKNNTAVEKLWNASVCVSLALLERNEKLLETHFLSPLIDTVTSKSSSASLTINDCIIIINRLIIYKFPIDKFNSIFSNLFFIRAKLTRSQSHLKVTLEEILFSLLSSNIRMIYSLDDTLFHKQSQYELYETFTSTGNDLTVHVRFVGESGNSATISDLEKVDDITQTCFALLNKTSDAFKVDFFLLLMDNMLLSSSPLSQLLLYAVIDTLQSSVSTLILNYPSQAIQFVVSSLERIANKYKCESFDLEKHEVDNEHIAEVRLGSLNICLQIMEQLINSNHQVIEDYNYQLNQCLFSVQKLIDLSKNGDEVGDIAKKIKSKLVILSEKTHLNSDSKKPQFEEAIKDLNDALLPVRTHGLITLRKLILSRNAEVLKEKQRLLFVIQALLSDEESYVYLAAIRTLAALALVSTDSVLPVLFEAFHDKQRTVQERVNVGEVLIIVSKGIGEMANHYSKSFVNELLRGTKDEEPTIRISSLSILGQFCALLKFGIHSYLIEIFHCVKALLQTDPFFEVKRASIMFIHLFLNSLDSHSLKVIETELLSIYRLLKHVYNTSLDDVLQLHCQLAIEQIDRLVRESLTCGESVKRIQII